jgi:hypothetical protein
VSGAVLVWMRRREGEGPLAPIALPDAARNRHTIFVSYSRKDWTRFVEPMIEQLRAQGLNVWVDQHLLVSGDNWMERINEALKTCDRMILCVSPTALESRYVKYEYRYFFNQNKVIYPIICRSVQELPPELQSIQYFPYNRVDELIAILHGAGDAAVSDDDAADERV